MMKKISIALGVIAAAAVVVAFAYHLNGEFALVNASGDNKPVVQTAPATDVTASSVTLHGIANNNGGLNGHVWFEYGTNPNAPVYADAWPAQVGVQSFGGVSTLNLSVPVSHLAPNTTYYYRVASENSAGQNHGGTLSFKTTTSNGVALECADGTTLTLPEVRANIANGKIKVSLANSTAENKAIGTIVNDTGCAFPVSQATFKMFDQQLATQVLMDYAPTAGNTTTIPAHTTITIKTALPSCMAQTDIFYGVGPTVLNNANNYPQNLTYNFYQNNASGYYNAAGNFCSNTPDLATLKIVKTVSNIHGGTKQVSDFTLFQNGVQVSSGQEKSYNFASLNDNKILTVSETNLAGYTASAWGGDCSADGKVTLHPGEHKTCTITNTDVAIIATCPNASGTLTLSETRAAIASGKITVSLANDAAGSKTIGIVHNDTECALPVSQVSYKMFDQQLATQELFDYAPAPTGSVLTIAPHTTGTLNTNLPVCMAQVDLFYGPGPLTLNNANNYPNNLAYVFSMNNASGYYNAAGNFCQHVQPQSSLKLIKTVVNTNGGTKVATDFPLFVNSTQVTTGQDTAFAPGTYKASETNLAGYTADVWGGDCAADGTVVLNAGDHKTCTITNHDNPVVVNPTTGCLAIHKQAFDVNNSRFNPTPVFTFQIDNGTTYNTDANGNVTISNLSVGNHTLTEVVPSGWTLQSVVPALTNNIVAIGAGSGCADETFTNKQTPIVIVTTGCNYCGGIAPPPPAPQVGVTSTTNPGQVAGVFLSQVPYTGIGSDLKIGLFMLALLSWSAWISYLIIKRKAAKSGLSVAQMFQGNPSTISASAMAFTQSPARVSTPHVAPVQVTAIPHVSKKPEALVESPFLEHMTQEPKEVNVPTDNTYNQIFRRINENVAPVTKYAPAMTAKKSEPSLVPEIAKPQAQIALPSSPSDVIDALEMQARELHTLVSADGLEIIAKASQNNKHNAIIILNHLVELYKGSEHEMNGDWMVLNGEKISNILFSTYITMTPVFIQWLAEGDDKKALSFVRMLQMQGQTVKDFVMNIVIELDKAYRFRVENMGDADSKILDSTMQWSNQELETVIHTLVTAVDQTYSSVYSSVKIALVKVLDLAKGKIYA
jgi:hypothetical protein